MTPENCENVMLVSKLAGRQACGAAALQSSGVAVLRSCGSAGPGHSAGSAVTWLAFYFLNCSPRLPQPMLQPAR
jgi:hypothetical protein